MCIKLNSKSTIPHGAINFDELIDTKLTDFSTLKVHERDPNSCVLLPFSSGTTGMPKAVILTHNNISSNCLAIHSKLKINNVLSDQYVYSTTETHQEVLPCVLPFFHILGWTGTLMSKIAIGSKIITLPRFTPESFLDILEKEKATVLHLAPPIGMFYVL